MSASVTAAPSSTLADFKLAKALLLRCVNWSLQQDSLLQTRRLGVSGWSPAEHLEHMALANRAILGAVRGLMNAPQPDAPSATNENASRFLEAGVIERGGRKHPDFVSPQGISLEYLRRELQAILDAYLELEPKLATIEASHATMPHPVLGPLTAAQWLRFMAIHTRHHLGILRDVAGGSL